MNTYMLDHTHKPEDCSRAFEELGKYDSPMKGQEYWCGCEGPVHHGCYFIVESNSPDEAMEQLPPWIRASAIAVEVSAETYP